MPQVINKRAQNNLIVVEVGQLITGIQRIELLVPADFFLARRSSRDPVGK